MNMNKIRKVIALGTVVGLGTTVLAGCYDTGTEDLNKKLDKVIESVEKVPVQDYASDIAALKTEIQTLKTDKFVAKEELDKKESELRTLQESAERDALLLQDARSEAAKLKIDLEDAQTKVVANTATINSAYFELPNNMLELGENVGDVKESFTENDLEGLRSGTISTDEGTTAYNQYLRFSGDDVNGAVPVYEENDDDIVGDYLKVSDGDTLYEYQLEFEEGAESEIGDDDHLQSLEDEELVILGRKWSVVRAVVDTDDKTLNMLLLGGSVRDTLEEGASKTYSVNGKEYEVIVTTIADRKNDATVKFVINGEVTRELKEGQTDRLNDGTLIGVRELLPNEAGEANGGDMVEFYLGAEKLELEGSYVSEDFTSSGVEYNDNSLNHLQLNLQGAVSGNTFKLSGLKLRLDVDAIRGDAYIAPGHKLSEYLREPESLLGVDIEYDGLLDVDSTPIGIRSRGDDEYRLEFTTNEGLEYSVPLVELVDETVVIGEEGKKLHVVEGADSTDYVIAKRDYFVVTDKSDRTGYTHVLKFEDIDVDNKKLTFSDLETGTKEVVYNDGKASLIVGGKTYDVYVNEATKKIVVDLNHDGTVNKGRVDIVVKGGGILSVSDVVDDKLTVTLKTQAKQFDDASVGDETVTFRIEKSGDELDIDVVDGLTLHRDDSNDDVAYGSTRYGVLAKVRENDNDADDVELDYPVQQRPVRAKVILPLVE